MNKLIATGTVMEDENVKVVASVYVDLDEEGKESAEAGSHYVTLSYRNDDAETQPADAMTYADIAGEEVEDESGEGGMVVPGFDGHDDVALEAPMAVRYSKTKSFMRKDGTIQVYAALRYVF